MVGVGTVRADNPALTVRLVKGRNPYRVVVVGRRPLPAGCQLAKKNADSRTIVAAVPEVAEKLSRRARVNGLTFWEVKPERSGRPDPADLMKKAAAFGLQSILVEGGSALGTALLKARVVDKIMLVIAPKVIGEGTPSIGDLGIRKLVDAVQLESVTVLNVGPDIVVTGYPKYSV
jgi:diaminohydroxyphosphoribosylaminopyrimidine deaminase/5-amino-6-(5-phosphoribosylamino)uracil reductase